MYNPYIRVTGSVAFSLYKNSRLFIFVMALPRKFSDKIALMTQKQIEGTAEFDAVLREVSASTRVTLIIMLSGMKSTLLISASATAEGGGVYCTYSHSLAAVKPTAATSPADWHSCKRPTRHTQHTQMATV